jgi:hypothetical protein
MPSLHAYRCTGPEAFGPDLPVGSTVRRKRGFRLGITLRDALADRARGGLGEGWPLRIFEVSVAEPDLAGTDADAGILRARAFTVAREVPLAEALGPRVDDVVAFLDGIPSIRWLRPPGAPVTDARVADLIAEHYRALSDYQSVTTPPVRVVRTWRSAQELSEGREPYYVSICESPAAGATHRVRRGTTLEGALRVAHEHAHVATYSGAWDAAWAAGGRGVVTGITTDPLFSRLGDDLRAGAGAVETVSVAHAAAREPARVASKRALVFEVFTPPPAEIPSGNEIFADAVAAARAAVARLPRPHLLHARDARGVPMLTVRDQMVTRFIMNTAAVGMSLAVIAARHAAWQVGYLLQNLEERDPWRPLLDVWRLGAWPMGEVGGAFVVYVPEAED